MEIETAFEDSKAERMKKKLQWEAAKGRFHMGLVAEREAGRVLTIADMKALEATAIDDVPYVRGTYLTFIEADSAYRAAKVKWEDAKRSYWDKKDVHR